jgi:mannose-6-phosphate isomerase-like protein (cupin superfamily)
MQDFFSVEITKSVVFQKVEARLLEKNFIIANKDEERPWGGFFVIEENQSEAFIKEFFFDVSQKSFSPGNKLSPKILIVESGKRLSWQYHFRRAELWKVVNGVVGVATSGTDEESEIKKHSPGSIITLKKGERHRLIGLDSWGIVAEIWQHSDNNYPSNEEDIVRLQDDYGR